MWTRLCSCWAAVMTATTSRQGLKLIRSVSGHPPPVQLSSEANMRLQPFTLLLLLLSTFNSSWMQWCFSWHEHETASPLQPPWHCRSWPPVAWWYGPLDAHYKMIRVTNVTLWCWSVLFYYFSVYSRSSENVHPSHAGGCDGKLLYQLKQTVPDCVPASCAASQYHQG